MDDGIPNFEQQLTEVLARIADRANTEHRQQATLLALASRTGEVQTRLRDAQTLFTRLILLLDCFSDPRMEDLLVLLGWSTTQVRQLLADLEAEHAFLGELVHYLMQTAPLFTEGIPPSPTEDPDPFFSGDHPYT